VDDVAVDEVFFHNYFNQIGKGKKAPGKRERSAKREEDVKGDDGGDENEDEIWQALVESQPEIEGYSEDDDDIEMLELDDSSGGSSDTNESEIEAENDEVADTGDFDEVSMGSEQEDESNMDELFSKELQTRHLGDASAEQKEESRIRRRRLKNLPTFASIEDYAEMLGEDGDEHM
jgi:ribosome biogenesis protein MAK21